MRESLVITKIKKLFTTTFDKCSFTKINISPIHGRGFPDLLIVTEYATFFIEAKAPGNKPTELQRAKLLEMKKAGEDSVRCYWATVKKGTKDVLIFMDPETDEVLCEIQTSRKRVTRKRVEVSGR